MAWINNDGLAVRLGKDEALDGNRGGVSSTDGPYHIIEYKLSSSDFGLAASRIFNETMTNIPKGHRIEKIEIFVESSFTSTGAATISMGAQTLSRTNLGNAVVLSAIPIATLVTGALLTYTSGSANAGSYIGSTLAEAVMLSGFTQTAALTGGRMTLRVYTSI